ncbi:MAG: C_GCAxxG_C_C family protein [Spirochaetales bacterium]|nr:C_GCAxxG_C_C family protein [Spirochaetales bacterium]
MSKKSDSAVNVFTNGFNCAQAVFTASSDELGLGRNIALKVSCGFGGGMGRTDGVCGAVTGAMMAISLKFGKASPDDNDAKEKTYMLISGYLQNFRDRHGSTGCTELAGSNLSIPAEVDKAREAGVFSTICPTLVRDSVELAEASLAAYTPHT